MITSIEIEDKWELGGFRLLCKYFFLSSLACVIPLLDTEKKYKKQDVLW
jgi:hypothetical protein